MGPSPLPDDEVIARYDRYLQQFVEALNICPFSRRAREGDRLARAVLRGQPGIDAAVEALKRVTSAPEDKLDVAVLILPDVELGPHDFSRWVQQVRVPFTRQSVPPNGYFLVAMHPDWPMDLSTPDRAVAFMRRTPHPSIQVSRARVIFEARGTSAQDEESTSDRVARLGLESVLRAGPEQVTALLDRIRHGLP